MIDKPTSAVRIWYGDGTVRDVTRANNWSKLPKTNVQVVMVRYSDSTYRIMHGTDYYWRAATDDYHQGDMLAEVPPGAVRLDGLEIASQVYVQILKDAFVWSGATLASVADLVA